MRVNDIGRIQMIEKHKIFEPGHRVMKKIRNKDPTAAMEINM